MFFPIYTKKCNLSFYFSYLRQNKGRIEKKGDIKMCTAIAFGKENRLFGRNLDVEGGYDEGLIAIPGIYGKNAAIGIGVIDKKGPLLFDGINSSGLYVCALNFTESGVLPRTRAEKSATYHDLLPYLVLTECTNVKEARALIESRVFIASQGGARLHFFISDKRESIAVEPHRGGMRILDNPAEILTNEPPLPYHLTRLREYGGLSPYPPTVMEGLRRPFSKGAGAMGLPGDTSSSSRFVRGYFLKEWATGEGDPLVLMRILTSLSVIKGCVREKEGMQYTHYTSVAEADNFHYHYLMHDSSEVTTVDGGAVTSGIYLPTIIPLRRKTLKT